MKYTVIGIVLLAVIVVVFHFQREPEWKQAYRACLKEMESETRKMQDSVPSEMRDNQFGEMMTGMTTSMIEGFGKAMCEVIREVCEDNPDSPECQHLIKVDWN